MNTTRKKSVIALLGTLTIAGLVVIWLRSSTGISYAGKPLSFWCDELPYTDQIPLPSGSVFARGYRTSTDPAEQKRFREMEKQALLAINALGTNCLPELLGRLQSKYSPLQFKSRKIAAKLGIIKRRDVGIWQIRRMQALTGIVELGHRSKGIVPQLTALSSDPDPWLSGAASYALKQIAQQGATRL